MNRNLRMILFLLALSTFVSGLEPGKNTPSDSPPRLDHILLEVTNMQASITFYQDMLYLKPKSRSKTFCTMSAGNIDIYLSTVPWGWKKPQGKGERLGLGMYPHFVFDNVLEVVARIKKAGYPIVQEPKEYDWGTEAFVADPDGYTWALVHLNK
jgi:catechol 2,3-dioxygenase-like lactoylglutathione lyase family enzyme